ncbi:hypothetical protein RMAECT_0733 [Rickettsia rhipicephali str. Ect]|uniref:Phosphodiester glycosidase domain-containing protein n=3 Tax=Rickettsia TaxID=780 RepID=A0A0F3PF42_RICRH|nr:MULTISPECIES: phosphodiester glycosidase family protein [spotted fever group]AFB30972.1 hypothetical protein RMB_00035 [Rickettsia massiliae str. AZT80]KJV78903.1 hypothetical protein RMAECT_0733 [Rickettsia rhipicephali str. Ect]
MIRLVYLFLALIISFKIYAKEYKGLTYNRYEKDKHVIHVLTIDPKNFGLKLVKAHNQVIGRETVNVMAHRTNAAAAINAGFFEIAGSDDGRPSLTLMIDGKLFSLRQQLQSLLIIDQGNIQITKASAKILVEIDDKSVIPNKDGKLINLSNAASIVTGIPLLIQNGKNVVDNPKQDDPAHARTALGVRNDGTIVVVEHIYKQHVKDLKLVQVRSILRKEKEINIPEALKILEKHLVNDTVIS